jgi:hypothetical protein
MLTLLEGIEADAARGLLELLEVMVEDGAVPAEDVPRWAWAIRAVVSELPETLH